VASVTERRRLSVEQAEAVLRESELMRSRAEVLADMGSWWWDAASDTFHPSPEWRRVTGATAGRLSRGRVQAHVYPPDLPEVRRRINHTIETGEPYDIEHRIVRPDNGKLRWVKVHAEAVRNEGMSVKLYGFTQDITERKRTEEALREKTYNLGERVKELNCINEVTEVLETWGDSLNQALRRIVEVMPPALQYPEVAAARIEIDGRRFVSAGFRETPWRLGKAIRAGGKPVGTVTLGYLEERPVSDEGPVLREERNLVDLIAHAFVLVDPDVDVVLAGILAVGAGEGRGGLEDLLAVLLVGLSVGPAPVHGEIAVQERAVTSALENDREAVHQAVKLDPLTAAVTRSPNRSRCRIRPSSR
jgi:PAS domain S-box-containing protein